MRPSQVGLAGIGEPQLRDTVPILASSLFHSVAQGQYGFVLPWMIVARGGSTSGAVLSAAMTYVPYLFTSPLAGFLGDRIAPRRLLCVVFGITGCASAAYPFSTLVGRHPPLGMIYASALVFGIGRPFVDAGSYRAIAAETPETVMRLQSARSILTQAGGFGGPAVGLFIFQWHGEAAVCSVVSALLLAAMLVSAAAATSSQLRTESAARALRSSFGYLRSSRRLKRLTLGIAGWNLAAGAAFSAVSPLLKQAGASADEASAVFLGGASTIVLLTSPVVRAGLQRLGALSVFTVAVAVEGTAFLGFACSTGVWLFPVYACFVLANSVAASSSSGARALAIRPEEQALLTVVLQAGISQAFLVGVLLSAVASRTLSLRHAAYLAAFVLVWVAVVAMIGRRRPPPVSRA